MDLGTYERFLDISISKEHNITTGRIYLRCHSSRERWKISWPMCTDNSAHYGFYKGKTEAVERKKLRILVVNIEGQSETLKATFSKSIRQLRFQSAIRL